MDASALRSKARIGGGSLRNGHGAPMGAQITARQTHTLTLSVPATATTGRTYSAVIKGTADIDAFDTPTDQASVFDEGIAIGGYVAPGDSDVWSIDGSIEGASIHPGISVELDGQTITALGDLISMTGGDGSVCPDQTTNGGTDDGTDGGTDGGTNGGTDGGTNGGTDGGDTGGVSRRRQAARLAIAAVLGELLL